MRNETPFPPDPDPDPPRAQDGRRSQAPLRQASQQALQPRPDGAAVARLEELVRAGRISDALALCRMTRSADAARGVTGENAALHARLLIPLIRRLEAAWTVDEIDFAHLSLAFLNLHRIIATLSDDLRPSYGAGRGRVLVSTAPGEEHRFGAQVLADLLRAAGWSVDLVLDADELALISRVAQTPYVALALSVGHDGALDGLGDLITTLRASACNGTMRVLLGGSALAEPRSQYNFLGADLVAQSSAEALGFLSASRMSLLHS
jgi:MerR family transcriptional regulator, light-induced transcriptional regulator